MTTHRFYCPGEITPGRILELPPNAAHHAARVLRLEPGDRVTLFNGSGGEFSTVIASIGKSGTTVTVEEHLAAECESPLDIKLVQAVCANEKMDWIIQKAVEMGVSRIQPIITTRSLIRLSDERADKRLQHWQQIVISACEQCGRNHLPQLLPVLSLSDWLSRQMGEHKILPGESVHNPCFMLLPTSKKRLRDFPEATQCSSLTVMVGPEGGFAPEEEAAALVAGLVPLKLGGRILRTETAALAAVAAMQALWGDY
ncbi:MAG: 16S rRNA (uracil(1498)-N(3))-methyltransferase [Nitrosospira sp.]|nr:16S rRNA (uracil(1498)-N(3))-methyltransferase [Nitrosospira sp.]MDW7647643.1 16S rRNA (uracil(1498)-N(3))-methyltransferase [Nitrosomonadaceae bacterium]MBI0409646.1 16S rRNA (uracil(1498)-N(3))-methyltransferase [Nitrosospira sp.]MBI0409802.1 16S rRNA (uracil(1498)-N(3))-methyltransferase [Nitrosospira sp.]MBI0412267.1 16S rRNA (uracil(1498)-N(3))-methyltransferase [Nitrosospira sp.]